MEVNRFDIRTSNRRVFRRCFRKWGFESAMRMNLTHKGVETNINFWFGSAIHFAMEDYFGYNRFGDPRLAFKAYYEVFPESDRPEGAAEYYDLGLAMLTYFIKWYPRHNNLYEFQTLWFNEKNEEVKPGTENSHPGVEQEFLLDLGYRVIIDSKGDIIKRLDDNDRLYRLDVFTTDRDLRKVPVNEIELNKEYEFLPLGEIPGYDDSYEVVKIVPICYHGTMDRLVKDKLGRWWILDYKTAKSADTNKLDTDDQISAYMWAAEQKFHHKFYGFIYLQLTKTAVKMPRRLKNGSLSVDKKQLTTYSLFRQELIKDYGEVNKAPNKLIEALNNFAEMETPEGDRFIRWDLVTRNDNQKINTYQHIMDEVGLMLSPNLKLFPNPTRDCIWDCPYREVCIEMDKGNPDSVEELINMNFVKRSDTLEHNDDSWKANIKWPEISGEDNKKNSDLKSLDDSIDSFTFSFNKDE